MRNVKASADKFSARTLRRSGTVHTVRAQALMEQQQKLDIGERIRDLREASPHTNRSIAEHVGVSERAVGKWIEGKGIEWDNLVAVADLFGVDSNWLWSGRALDDRGPAPDPFADPYAEQLDRIEEKLDEILRRLAEPDPTPDEFVEPVEEADAADEPPAEERRQSA